MASQVLQSRAAVVCKDFLLPHPVSPAPSCCVCFEPLSRDRRCGPFGGTSLEVSPMGTHRAPGLSPPVVEPACMLRISQGNSRRHLLRREQTRSLHRGNEPCAWAWPLSVTQTSQPCGVACLYSVSLSSWKLSFQEKSHEEQGSISSHVESQVLA